MMMTSAADSSSGGLILNVCLPTVKKFCEKKLLNELLKVSMANKKKKSMVLNPFVVFLKSDSCRMYCGTEEKWRPNPVVVVVDGFRRWGKAHMGKHMLFITRAYKTTKKPSRKRQKKSVVQVKISSPYGPWVPVTYAKWFPTWRLEAKKFWTRMDYKLCRLVADLFLISTS